MNDYTFKSFSSALSHELHHRAETILDLEYPKANHATTKDMARTGVADFISSGEPVAYKHLPAPAGDPHFALRQYYMDLGEQHQKVYRTRQLNSLVLNAKNQRTPTRAENVNDELVQREEQLKVKQHVAAGRVCAATALLTFRDHTFEPGLQEAIAQAAQKAQSSAGHNMDQIPRQPTSKSSHFSLFDHTGLIAPRP